MVKYLWDLNLDEIPLGWENTYQEASIKSPHGEIVSIPESNYDEISINRYFYHPVKYRNELYRLFNEFKVKAKDLFESKGNHEFRPFINELIKYDCILYNILYEWTLVDDELDGSSFDPDYIKNILQNFRDYFDSSSFETDFDKQYNKYKLINL
ncbi:hypothetical protein [Tissierella praeacuta]|uniref:hypothetical protein n=1 Tax=Tissierella praeacuta TaxID=43131 RepID=UPI003341A4B0